MINNFGPKGHFSKTIPILRSDASIWKALYGMCRCPEQMSQKNDEKKNKRKNDCHVMHLKNSIKPKWESRMSKKMMKNRINTNHFPFCKELLFSLGNYVWDEKWPSFIIPSLIWKLSIVTPFEPDKFSSISRSRITLHTGGQRQREIFSRA